MELLSCFEFSCQHLILTRALHSKSAEILLIYCYGSTLKCITLFVSDTQDFFSLFPILIQSMILAQVMYSTGLSKVVCFLAMQNRKRQTMAKSQKTDRDIMSNICVVQVYQFTSFWATEVIIIGGLAGQDSKVFRRVRKQNRKVKAELLESLAQMQLNKIYFNANYFSFPQA